MTTETGTVKVTPLPWVAGTNNIAEGQDAGGYTVMVFAGKADAGGRMPAIAYGPTPEIARANAEFIAAACNSYATHCDKPVECAEADLLGQIINGLQQIADNTAPDCPWVQNAKRDPRRQLEEIRHIAMLYLAMARPEKGGGG